jgi:hypothetical protein
VEYDWLEVAAAGLRKGGKRVKPLKRFRRLFTPFFGSDGPELSEQSDMMEYRSRK